MYRMERDGDGLVVIYDDGSTKRFDLKELAKRWFSMNNDKFYEMHGFDWPFGVAGQPVRPLDRDKVQTSSPQPVPKPATQQAHECGTSLTDCPSCRTRQVFCTKCETAVAHNCH
jgi:hypothetical protein